MGFVTSFAHPGGNITGFALYDQAIGVKWLELAKQIAPHIIEVAVIYDPAAPQSMGYLRAIEAGVAPVAVQLTSVAVRDAAEIEGALDTLARKPSSGLIMLPGAIDYGQSRLDHRDGRSASSTGCLPRAFLRYKRRSRLLWRGLCRSIPTRCFLCGSH